MTLIVWMYSRNGQENPQPIYLADPKCTGTKPQQPPVFSPLFHTLPRFMTWLTICSRKPSSPASSWIYIFSVLSEIAQVSGVCPYIASEKLVTLKGSHLLRVCVILVIKEIYKAAPFLCLFFFTSSDWEFILDDIWYKYSWQGFSPCSSLEQIMSPKQVFFVE